MEYNLRSIGKIESTMGNEYVLGTTFGRVYVNSNIKDYELVAPNKLRIGTNTINLPEKTQYRNITYTHSALRTFNLGELLGYFKIGDYFLERLIRENINCSFENIYFLKDIPLSDTDKYSLLKSVHYRYISIKRNNYRALKVIGDNLKKRSKREL